MERTLIILKPDAVQRGLIGEIIHRLERRGLQIVGLKLMLIDQALAERHYSVHKGRSFYEGLIRYITSGPVVVGVLAGKDAVAQLLEKLSLAQPAGRNETPPSDRASSSSSASEARQGQPKNQL